MGSQSWRSRVKATRRVSIRPGAAVPAARLVLTVLACLAVVGYGATRIDLTWSLLAGVAVAGVVLLTLRGFPVLAILPLLVGGVAWGLALRAWLPPSWGDIPELLRFAGGILAYVVPLLGTYFAAIALDSRHVARAAIDEAVSGRRRWGERDERLPQLAELEILPAARFFARSTFGEPPGACSDIVASGRRVALFLPTVWPQGQFTVDASGQVMRGGRPFAPGSGDLGNLAAEIRVWQEQLAGTGAAVRGYLVVTPSRGDVADRLVIAAEPGEQFQLVHAQEVVDAAGAWLAAEPYRVDLAVMGRLFALAADASTEVESLAAPATKSPAFGTGPGSRHAAPLEPGSGSRPASISEPASESPPASAFEPRSMFEPRSGSSESESGSAAAGAGGWSGFEPVLGSGWSESESAPAWKASTFEPEPAPPPGHRRRAAHDRAAHDRAGDDDAPLHHEPTGSPARTPVSQDDDAWASRSAYELAPSWDSESARKLAAWASGDTPGSTPTGPPEPASGDSGRFSAWGSSSAGDSARSRTGESPPSEFERSGTSGSSPSHASPVGAPEWRTGSRSERSPLDPAPASADQAGHGGSGSGSPPARPFDEDRSPADRGIFDRDVTPSREHRPSSREPERTPPPEPQRTSREAQRTPAAWESAAAPVDDGSAWWEETRPASSPARESKSRRKSRSRGETDRHAASEPSWRPAPAPAQRPSPPKANESSPGKPSWGIDPATGRDTITPLELNLDEPAPESRPRRGFRRK